jgi:hypothetical protein
MGFNPVLNPQFGRALLGTFVKPEEMNIQRALYTAKRTLEDTSLPLERRCTAAFEALIKPVEKKRTSSRVSSEEDSMLRIIQVLSDSRLPHQQRCEVALEMLNQQLQGTLKIRT